MIFKKILILSVLSVLSIVVFVIFFWDIPAPTNKIEKELEIHRFKTNDKN